MKILHTSDLHFEKEWFKWIEEQQENFDIFCISGDFLESNKDATLQEQIVWISRWIKKFKKPLFTCTGNHDIIKLGDEDWLNKIDTSNYYPDYSKRTIKGIRFGCFPYIGAEYYDFDDCNVLVTHVPPQATKTSMEKSANDWGDAELRRVIKSHIISPKIILCGHIHTPLKRIDTLNNTTIYNTGFNTKSAIPNHHIVEI